MKNSNFLGIGNPNLSKVSQKKTFKDLSLFNLSTRGILKDKSLITDNFESIPYTKKEIKALSKYFKNRKILLSSDANENNLKSLDLFKFNIISFATHAAVSGSLEGTSEPFLVLTPPKISNEINDGILTASEITQLNLDADLVLLSACDTASKENQYSPGFSGLVASFIQAGSKNVLATHWPVADKATSIMVLETIKKVRKQKMEIVEALKLTKIEFINGKYGNKYKNPFYWAPYILIGS